MYNPFPLLDRRLLAHQVGKGKRWFVRQTFPRGRTGRIIESFLIRGYDADEQELAKAHLASMDRDKNSFLYDAINPEHLSKLNAAAGAPFGYKIYYAAKKGVDWNPPEDLEASVRRYISLRHPNWQLQRDGGEILVGLYEVFGELFIKFNHRDEEDMVSLVTVEQY